MSQNSLLKDNGIKNELKQKTLSQNIFTNNDLSNPSLVRRMGTRSNPKNDNYVYFCLHLIKNHKEFQRQYANAQIDFDFILKDIEKSNNPVFEHIKPLGDGYHDIYNWKGYSIKAKKTSHHFNQYSDKEIYLIILYGLFYTRMKYNSFYSLDPNKYYTKPSRIIDENKNEYQVLWENDDKPYWVNKKDFESKWIKVVEKYEHLKKEIHREYLKILKKKKEKQITENKEKDIVDEITAILGLEKENKVESTSVKTTKSDDASKKKKKKKKKEGKTNNRK